MTDLKPCPFCGNVANIGGDGYGSYVTDCVDVNCRAYSSGGDCGNKDEVSAVTQWNSRSSTWVSVKDRLPDEGVNVLAVFSDMELLILRIESGYWIKKKSLAYGL